MLRPFEFGSGGKFDGIVVGNSSITGGSGVRIFAQSVDIFGKILMNAGSCSLSPYCSGGSGGSIWIVADSISGSSNTELSVNGGAATVGGGGGGRIAIYANSSNLNLKKITAYGGPGLYNGGAGTIFMKVNFNENGYFYYIFILYIKLLIFR